MGLADWIGDPPDGYQQRVVASRLVAGGSIGAEDPESCYYIPLGLAERWATRLHSVFINRNEAIEYQDPKNKYGRAEQLFFLQLYRVEYSCKF